MVSVISKYKCDICNRVYNTLEEANKCEEKGYTETPSFSVGDTYNFVISFNHGQYGEPDYEGIEIVKIVDIIHSHKVIYHCNIYDEYNHVWDKDIEVIEGDFYFKHWNRGKVCEI